MKIDKEDILYVLLIPFIGLFLVGFYLFLGVMIVLVASYTGIVLLYDKIRDLDFGFDKDYGMDWTKRK